MAFSDVIVGLGIGLGILECDIKNIPDSISEGYHRMGENFNSEKQLTKDELIEKIIKKISKIAAKAVLECDSTEKLNKKSAKLIADGYALTYKGELKEMKKKELKKFLKNLEDIDVKDLSKEELKQLSKAGLPLEDWIKFAEEYLAEEENPEEEEDSSDENDDSETSDDEEQEESEEEQEEEAKAKTEDIKNYNRKGNSKFSTPKKEKDDKKKETKENSNKKGRKPATTKK